MGAGLRASEFEECQLQICLQLGLLELNGSIKLLNSILEALLIEEDFATTKRVREKTTCGTIRRTSNSEVRCVEGSVS